MVRGYRFVQSISSDDVGQVLAKQYTPLAASSSTPATSVPSIEVSSASSGCVLFTIVPDSVEQQHSLLEALEALQQEAQGGGHGSNSRAVFGVSLEQQWAAQHEAWLQNGSDLPEVVTATVAILLEHGLAEEGLFRLSAQQTRLTELRREFNRGALPALPPTDVHLAAGLLKLWLRELPEPLVPPAFAPTLQQHATAIPADGAAGAALRALAECTAQLPQPNLLVLQHLFFLLSRVVAYESLNKMGVTNLCVIFVPALFPSDPAAMMAGFGGSDGADYAVIRAWIQHYDTIFKPIESQRARGWRTRAPKPHGPTAATPSTVTSPSAATVGSTRFGRAPSFTHQPQQQASPSAGAPPISRGSKPETSHHAPSQTQQHQQHQQHQQQPQSAHVGPTTRKDSSAESSASILPPMAQRMMSRGGGGAGGAGGVSPGPRGDVSVAPGGGAPPGGGRGGRGVPLRGGRGRGAPRGRGGGAPGGQQSSRVLPMPTATPTASAALSQSSSQQSMAPSASLAPSSLQSEPQTSSVPIYAAPPPQAISPAPSVPVVSPSTPTCKGCKGSVTGESLSALGSLWHRACFVCTTCRCDLSQGFVEHQGQPYCAEHYSLAAQPPTQQQLPLCGGCGHAIEGSHLKAAGRTWHPEHFLCGNCRASLQSGFAEVNGYILCGGCAIAFSTS
eukprot:CAMPEP_0177653780 /NCGR_PEP_ID=MMETSP0447-20121125/13934_1 /TAXON_ID=0 /ORGANISM="Stygamoeba regulata, Strain BSH-02190019" /LENGTH=673 /DNA_ID=CAMNT_0019157291 /DNA_START=1 /DNA_END=2022 /DNA_ORIENTATION=+